MNDNICERPPPHAPDDPGSETSQDLLQDDDPVVRTAKEHFGISYLFPFQRLVVANTLEGCSQIVILPTGAGKSLCFQLPSLLLPGPTLVIFPLLSLLADQQRRLSAQGIRSGILRGGQSAEEREKVFREAKSGEIRLVLTNPETAIQERVLREIGDTGFSHLVVDEAHCVSEWGETFRPVYLELPRIMRSACVPVLTAFTATASPQVLEKIRTILFPDSFVQCVQGNADRPNISYEVIRCESKDHEITRLCTTVTRPLLVFARSRNDCERISALLRRRLRDNRILFYHAGLTREEKAAVEKYFFDSPDGVLVSTTAYGMGVDKSNIRTVIHAHVPASVESYLQESGRAGRDREPSTAVLLFSTDDTAHGARLESALIRERYERMIGYAGATSCRREYLLALMGQTEVTCFGCDVCDGRNGTDGDRVAQAASSRVIAFLRRYGKKVTREETVSILTGERLLSLVKKCYHRLPEYESLEDWYPEDLDAVVENMKARGVVEEKPILPFRKGTVYLSLTGRSRAGRSRGG